MVSITVPKLRIMCDKYKVFRLSTYEFLDKLLSMLVNSHPYKGVKGPREGKLILPTWLVIICIGTMEMFPPVSPKQEHCLSAACFQTHFFQMA